MLFLNLLVQNSSRCIVYIFDINHWRESKILLDVIGALNFVDLHAIVHVLIGI